MRWHTEHHWIETKNKREFINITDLVESSVRKAGTK